MKTGLHSYAVVNGDEQVTVDFGRKEFRVEKIYNDEAPLYTWTTFRLEVLKRLLKEEAVKDLFGDEIREFVKDHPKFILWVEDVYVIHADRFDLTVDLKAGKIRKNDRETGTAEVYPGLFRLSRLKEILKQESIEE